MTWDASSSKRKLKASIYVCIFIQMHEIFLLLYMHVCTYIYVCIPCHFHILGPFKIHCISQIILCHDPYLCNIEWNKKNMAESIRITIMRWRNYRVELSNIIRWLHGWKNKSVGNLKSPLDIVHLLQLKTLTCYSMGPKNTLGWSITAASYLFSIIED